MSVTNVYNFVKFATLFMGQCALIAGVMMVGPILQAFGVIGG